MALPTPLEDLPVRIVTGAFILNSGLGKVAADSGTAEYLHGFASGTYPFLRKLPPERFAKLLAATEIGVGTALLLPFIPSRIAGAGLAAFAGGLVGLYVRTPGMRKKGSIRPTDDGIALAKDSWMVGAALTLMAADQRRRHNR
ncbi:MAG: hypothetical protein ACRDMV_06270 [Streptosporangiales bacterium]